MTALNLLGFLRLNWKVVAAVSILLAALAWQRHEGAQSVRKADAKRTERAEKHAAQVSSQLSDQTTKAGTEAQASRDRIVYRTREVIKRIPQDVPTGSAADVRLGAGWVRNYSAGLGLPDDPRLASVPADKPVISAADALAGIDGNSSVCLQYKDAYERMVVLHDQERAAVNGFRP